MAAFTEAVDPRSGRPFGLVVGVERLTPQGGSRADRPGHLRESV